MPIAENTALKRVVEDVSGEFRTFRKKYDINIAPIIKYPIQEKTIATVVFLLGAIKLPT